MASVDRVPPVSPSGLSTSLHTARIDPDRKGGHHPQEDKPEKQFDKLELHEEEADETSAPATPVLLDYEGLDLSA